MNIKIITAFPELMHILLKVSKNISECIKKKLNCEVINLRDYGRVDDQSFSSNGMLYKYDTMSKCINNNKLKNIIYLSPDGQKLNQDILHELSQFDEISLISCRYEGMDARIVDKHVDYCISIGDYVLSNGEIASLTLLDALFRTLGTVKEKSLDDSFTNKYLDHDSFTHPRVIDGLDVPDILFSGNEAKIKLWKKKYKIMKTLLIRPDLLKNKQFSQDEKKILMEIQSTINDLL